MAHMSLIMLKLFSLATFALLLFLAKGWAGELSVIEAYAPKSLTPTASSAAVYFTISNSGVADRIISISTSAAATAMVHESKIVDGIASMDMLEGVDVPADGTVVMAQGGLHVMLMGLKAPLKQGETLVLEVTFERAGVMKIEVPVTGLVKPAP
jgi:periplasmic copper chaperone A